jgi:hypothetical protein
MLLIKNRTPFQPTLLSIAFKKRNKIEKTEEKQHKLPLCQLDFESHQNKLSCYLIMFN